MKDAGHLGAGHIAGSTTHLSLTAEEIPMNKGGQGIMEMRGVVTWKSAPQGLTHLGMVVLVLVTIPTVQEVTSLDLEALTLGGLYLIELRGAIQAMKIHLVIVHTVHTHQAVGIHHMVMGHPVMRIILIRGGMAHHLGVIETGIDMMNIGIIAGGEGC